MSRNGERPATNEDLAEPRGEFLDAMRKLVWDFETHVLNAFYEFAESNRKHLAELHRSRSALREQIVALEARVFEIEKRLNFPPPAR